MAPPRPDPDTNPAADATSGRQGHPVSSRSDSGPDETGPARATLGGGCFWCLEAVFRRAEGVTEVVSGYAGGSWPVPSYSDVVSGRTGHAEVVQVEFEPARISFREILQIFFTIHDPTTPNRQGADVGPQYRSIILFHDEHQEAVARQVMAEVEASGAWHGKVVTELAPMEGFHPAEPEHQEFYERNRRAGYCRLVIDPKLAAARRSFADRMVG